jgi:glycogen debranching enzyme
LHEGVNPGGYYKAVWCRDASYILKDWFLSGRFEDVMEQIQHIWSRQVVPEEEGVKIVYGRGSPDMKYKSQVASLDFKKTFEGALPTSIFHGHSEVFGKNPDIDSTALMISTTSWIFDAYLAAELESKDSPDILPKIRAGSRAPKGLPIPSYSEIIDSISIQMLKAVDYLRSRDLDNDGLLEQDHNEDWMDSVLRAGKIVYTQACWIMGLTNLSLLLSHTKMAKEAAEMRHMAEKTVSAVEDQLWSEEEGCYLDKQESHHLGKSYKTLTQDVSVYLIATTEKTVRDMLGSQIHSDTTWSDKRLPIRQVPVSEKMLSAKAASTLDAIKNRIWADKWPLCTETELKTSGPWILDPNIYHNHTFWPWTTGLEMLARSRYKRYEECAALFSYLSRTDREGNPLAFYEWLNPITGKGSRAFPFRTGISAIRIALTEILGQMDHDNDRMSDVKSLRRTKLT